MIFGHSALAFLAGASIRTSFQPALESGDAGFSAPASEADLRAEEARVEPATAAPPSSLPSAPLVRRFFEQLSVDDAAYVCT